MMCRFRGEKVDRLMRFIDEHGVKFVVIVSIPVLIEELILDGWFRAFKLLLYGIIVFLLTYSEVLMWKKTMKVRRGRIRTWMDYRYPSMHTAIGTAMGLLPLFFNPWLFWTTFLIPLGIYNRLKLRRHTWVEILGGIFAGTTAMLSTLIGFQNLVIGGFIVWFVLVLPWLLE